MSSLFDSGIRPAIDQWLLDEAAKVRDYGNYWSASSAGYCQRRVIFERLKVPHVSVDARKQRVFTSGRIFHEWIQNITKAAGLSIAQELELQDEELMIRGHIDDLVLITGPEMVAEMYGNAVHDETGSTVTRTPDKDFTFRDKADDHLILYDYKTAHSKSFTYSKGRPMSYYHKMQLGTYMYMLRNLAWAELERRKK